MKYDPICRPKVFIACSSKSVALAEVLKQALNATKEYEAQTWLEDFHKPNTILQNLFDACEDSDLFIVLLTRDDYRKSISSRRRAKTWVPRDNCVFELGLFVGASRCSFARVFLFTSIPKESLPTDLQGQLYNPFDESALKDPSSHLATIERMVEIVRLRTRDMLAKGDLIYLGSVKNALNPISITMLIDRERDRQNGGDLAEQSELFINSDQPVEMEGNDALRQVIQNLERGIRYTYFFRQDADPGDLALLIRKLAGANLAIPQSTPLAEINSALRDSQGLVETALEAIRSHLRIVLQEARSPWRYCIHNANRPHEAVCYLRTEGNQFVRLYRGEKAHAVARDLRPHIVEQGGVFDNGKLLMDRLRSKLNENFPEQLRRAVYLACFGD
jgi:hypothetical protein